MTHRDEVWQAAENAAEAVGPEAGLFASGAAGLRFWATVAREAGRRADDATTHGKPPPPRARRGPGDYVHG
jgi:hypothetical protein